MWYNLSSLSLASYCWQGHFSSFSLTKSLSSVMMWVSAVSGEPRALTNTLQFRTQVKAILFSFCSLRAVFASVAFFVVKCSLTYIFVPLSRRALRITAVLLRLLTKRTMMSRCWLLSLILSFDRRLSVRHREISFFVMGTSICLLNNARTFSSRASFSPGVC